MRRAGFQKTGARGGTHYPTFGTRQRRCDGFGLRPDPRLPNARRLWAKYAAKNRGYKPLPLSLRNRFMA